MMIVTKTLTAAAGLVASYLAVTAILAPPPVQVHALRYEDGFVYQDRTITTDGDYFFAFWSAKLIDAETRLVIRHCQGDGSWPYSTGRIDAPIPLDEWVGSDECTPDSLDPARLYIPVASWSWGDDSTSHEGEPFSID